MSDVIDFDKLEWGKTHSIESGTGSGKSYACYKQLKYLIHAVPLVGQVKQFSKKYGSKPVYAGHKLEKSAWQHTTTYDGLHKFVHAHDKGEFDLAIGDFDYAIALDKNNEDAYYNKSIAFWQKRVAMADEIARQKQEEESQQNESEAESEES